MRSTMLGFVLGVWLLQQQSTLSDAMLWYLCFFSSGCLLYFRLRLHGIWIRFLAASLAGILLGWAWASCVATIKLNERIPATLEEKDMVVVGVINSLPTRTPLGERFEFKLEKVLTPGIVLSQLPRKVLLSFYGGRSFFTVDTDNPQVSLDTSRHAVLQPGQRWQFKVRLRRPHGLANPYGLDYEMWLLERGLGATGSVKKDADNHLITSFVWSINNAVEWLRAMLREKILSALSGHTYASVIVALVIGEQSAISQTDWAIFAKTGISHLIAISGLHITLISGLFAQFIFYLWRHKALARYQLPFILPAQKSAALANVCMAFIYVALAGFGIPAQRTLIMVTVGALAIWFDRIPSVSHILVLALAAVLLIDPWAVLSPGFWLSFVAVGILFYISLGKPSRTENQPKSPLSNATVLRKHSFIETWRTKLYEASITQYAITLGLLPLTVLLFAQVSIIGPVANALAIPLVTFVITPCALIGSILPTVLGDFFLKGAHVILEKMVWWLTDLSQLNWAVWHAPHPSIFVFLCAMVGVIWCLAPRGWPLRWAGVFTFLPLIYEVSAAPLSHAFTVTALDVGQGTAVLIETEKHRLLYDTGAAYLSGSDAGINVIYPYLSMRGINHLDAMMISHRDKDHSGGALSLLDRLTIPWVSSSLLLSSELSGAIQKKSIHTTCLAGQHWEWDGISFEVLHPTGEIYEDMAIEPNNKSCVLKVSNDQYAVLLTGDIEAEQEKRLVRDTPEKLAAHILFAPHHGSGTSSTMAFLEAVHPEFAIFQLGYHNPYKHPKETIWQRYAELGVARLRSDRDGAITVKLSDKIEVSSFRLTHARYWHTVM